MQNNFTIFEDLLKLLNIRSIRNKHLNPNSSLDHVLTKGIIQEKLNNCKSSTCVVLWLEAIYPNDEITTIVCLLVTFIHNLFVNYFICGLLLSSK